MVPRAHCDYQAGNGRKCGKVCPTGQVRCPEHKGRHSHGKAGKAKVKMKPDERQPATITVLQGGASPGQQSLPATIDLTSLIARVYAKANACDEADYETRDMFAGSLKSGDDGSTGIQIFD